MKPLYVHTDVIHNMTAPREVVPVIMNLTNPKSVLDVGCGTATWLKAFGEFGVSDIIGVDAVRVSEGQLNIPVEKFVVKDLRTRWSLHRKFDLVVSLEVAEHLPEASADQFVKTLVEHANNTIVFSASVPGQGGQNHLNEQWPEYWQKKFACHGFYFHDVIRSVIWENANVDWWYRQNIFLLNKEQSTCNILGSYHPVFHQKTLSSKQEQFQSLVDGRFGVWESFKIFLRAIRYKILL